MKSAEYHSLLDSLPYGKRLPGAIYLLDPGSASDALPAKLRITVAELRKRLDIGPDFNLLKFHTASPKISFLAYPAFDQDPHPALAKIDLKRRFVTVFEDPPGPKRQLLFFKERFLATDHPHRGKMDRFAAKLRKLGLREETIGHGMTREAWELLQGSADL